MVAWITDPLNNVHRLGGACFMSNTSTTDIEYKIRLSSSPRNSGENGIFKKDLDWKTNLIFSIFPILGPREKNSEEGGDPGYWSVNLKKINKFTF